MTTISEFPILPLSGAWCQAPVPSNINNLCPVDRISTSEIHLGESMYLLFDPTTRDKNIYLAINKRFVPYIYFFSSE